MRFLALVILTAAPALAEPRFENRSDALPAHSYEGGWEHFVGGGVAVFDCNADDRPDIFAVGGTNPSKLIRNLGDFRFAEVEIEKIEGATGAYPINIDGDAFTDLFVLRVGANVVLKGGPDCTFEAAGDTWGIPPSDQWSTAFTAWWESGEDRPTMVIGNYVDRFDPDGPFEACDTNAVLRPGRDGYAAETLEPGFCPLSVLAARDARGRLTLRLSNDRHYYVTDGHEQMWDIEERRFLGSNDGWDRLALWGMGIASRDLTGDGRDEVMLTSMGDQVLQIAEADGTYKPAPFGMGTYAQRPHTGDDGRPSTGWHAEFADLDNDGRSDLFIAKGNVDQMPGMATRDPNNLLWQGADGSFTEVARAAGVATTDRSRGAAFADFDGDGRLDLIVSNRRAPLELYRNVTPDTGNWVRITLQQPSGNRDAVGAVISVVSDAHSQSVQQVIGGGHAGGRLLPRHFGIGSASGAEVQVIWPDGTTTRSTVPAGTHLTITKP